MSPFKGQGAPPDTVKVDSNKRLAEISMESEQGMVRWNVAIVDCHREEKLARSLVTEFVSAVITIVQQLGYDAVSRLRQGTERSYLTERVLYPMSLTNISGAADSRILCKRERSRDKKESDRPTVVLPRPGKVL